MCADEDPVYIVMEFMPGGALLDYLRKKGSLQTKRKLCSMCLDASRVSKLRYIYIWCMYLKTVLIREVSSYQG